MNYTYRGFYVFFWNIIEIFLRRLFKLGSRLAAYGQATFSGAIWHIEMYNLQSIVKPHGERSFVVHSYPQGLMGVYVSFLLLLFSEKAISCGGWGDNTASWDKKGVIDNNKINNFYINIIWYNNNLIT